jgi:uncharacterized protein DUF3800
MKPDRSCATKTGHFHVLTTVRSSEALAFFCSLLRSPFVAIVNFYCDESGKYQTDRVVTIAGVGTTIQQADKFDDEWRALLRSYELNELHMSHVADLNQKCGVHMPSGQTVDERTDALLPFADCINRSLQVGLVQAWDVNGYNSLSLEVKRELGGSHDPHQLAFIRGMLEIVRFVQEEDRISTICDDGPTAWDSYVHYLAVQKAVPKLRKKFVGLTFAHSAHFPPLQAADMVAFLARRQAREEFYGESNQFKRLHDYLTTDPPPNIGLMRWFKSFVNEQKMVDLANVIRQDQAKANVESRKQNPHSAS